MVYLVRMKKGQKGFLVPLVLLVIAAAGIAAGVYFNQQKGREGFKPEHIAPTIHEAPGDDTLASSSPAHVEIQEEPEKTVNEPVVESGEARKPASKKYTNTEFGFSVRYPARLVVEEGGLQSDTRFVVWKDPSRGNAKVTAIYISDAPLALPGSARAEGEAVTVGGVDALLFSKGGVPFYLVEQPTYSLAIQIAAPAGSSQEQATIDLASFAF